MQRRNGAALRTGKKCRLQPEGQIPAPVRDGVFFLIGIGVHKKIIADSTVDFVFRHGFQFFRGVDARNLTPELPFTEGCAPAGSCEIPSVKTVSYQCCTGLLDKFAGCGRKIPRKTVERTVALRKEGNISAVT